MKMAVKGTAENKFGQVLICLRMTQLNYVVKETPYSAYVTIRKKFVKSYDGELFEEEFVESIEKSDKAANDATCLKQQVLNLEKECGMLRYEAEEFEIEYKALESKKVELDDHIEELLIKKRDLNKDNENHCDDNKKLRGTVNELSNEIKQKSLQLFKKKDNLEKCIEEKDANILMLENVIQSHGNQIVRLKTQLESFEPSTSVSYGNCNEEIRNDSEEFESKNDSDDDSMNKIITCKECDFVARSEQDMKKHVEEHHVVDHGNLNICNEETQFACKFCDLILITEDDWKAHKIRVHQVECAHCKESFEKHICRIHLENPEYMDMYMKNWYSKNDCIRVFSRRQKKEIIIIHSGHCWEDTNFCCDVPENLNTSEKQILDTNNILHVPGKKLKIVVENCSTIYWEALRCNMDKLTGYHVY